MRELSLHLLDLLQNSREAGASELIVEIIEDSAKDELLMRVVDNGRGIPEGLLAKVIDPFFTTRHTRNVGLGLPLLKGAAEQTGGSLTVNSQPGRTEVVARFGLNNIDRAPLGNIAGSLLGVLLSDKPARLIYRHCVNGEKFEFDSQEAQTMLGDVPFSEPSVSRWLQSYLNENIKALRAGMAP